MAEWIIGVIGAGAMGSGIAQVAAMAGHEVKVFDNNQLAHNLPSLFGARDQYKPW